MKIEDIKIDHEYIAERDRLIPEAEAFANKAHGKTGLPGGDWAEKWSRTFISKMNSLWANRPRKEVPVEEKS